jgi:hypothetical protein
MGVPGDTRSAKTWARASAFLSPPPTIVIPRPSGRPFSRTTRTFATPAASSIWARLIIMAIEVAPSRSSLPTVTTCPRPATPATISSNLP